MQKGIVLFLTVYVVLLLASGAAYFALSDNAQAAQGVGMGLGVLVFILAYIAHKASGAIGNPFNGLVLGKASSIALTWIGGIVAGLAAIGVAVGMRFTAIDPDMGWFLGFVAQEAAKNGGQAMPESAIGVMKVTFKIMSIAGPIAGTPFLAAIMCLGFFPVYGWLGRRLMARGTGYSLAVLGGLGILSSASAGLLQNPMFPDYNMPLSVAIGAGYGLALTAVLVWLFMVSNSVVVPAVGFAAFMSTVSAAQYYYADPQAHMIPPNGLADMIIMAILAMALWMAKTPDAKRVAVVAVAFDGSSLNEDQLRAIEQSQRSPYGQAAAEAPGASPFVAAAPDGEATADAGNADADGGAPGQG